MDLSASTHAAGTQLLEWLVQAKSSPLVVVVTSFVLSFVPHVGWLTLTLVILVVVAVMQLSPQAALPQHPASAVAGGRPEDGKEPGGDPLRWSFLPSTGVLRANEQPFETENEFCRMKALALHRPTHDKHRLAKGDYPYSWHMHGRKRIFEIRIQMRFKKRLEGSLHFGLETEFKKDTTESAKRRTNRYKTIILQTLRTVLGASSTDDFYCSPGDDPSCTDGAEPPTFVFPLWAIDQFHVASPGEEPDLAGNFEHVGYCRTDGLTTYISEMHNTMRSMSCDKVYTFLFWGVSKYVDVINWEFRGIFPGFRCNFNTLCGQPPIYAVLYELKQDTSGGDDQRHRVARRNYLFKVALWSDLHPPGAPSKTIDSVLAKDAGRLGGPQRRGGSDGQIGTNTKMAAWKTAWKMSAVLKPGCCAGLKAALCKVLPPACIVQRQSKV